MKGWVKLHRTIINHPILTTNKIYSRLEAFIHFLLKANHTENKVVIGNKLYKVQRGSFITSQKKLMRQFCWGSSKLRAFLNLLEQDEMIIVKSLSKATQITICNYSKLQGLRNENGTETESKQNNNRKQTETINKVIKNKKNIKEREQEFINKTIASASRIKPNPHPDIVEQFNSYWTEKNFSRTKMKFEMEKTWDTSRRLRKWIQNSIEWNIKNKEDLEMHKKEQRIEMKYQEQRKIYNNLNKGVASDDERKKALGLK